MAQDELGKQEVALQRKQAANQEAVAVKERLGAEHVILIAFFKGDRDNEFKMFDAGTSPYPPQKVYASLLALYENMAGVQKQ